ncbi:MAG: MFS transporter [Pseudomonadota bacterium]|nr:MFS transporter [Pseudomonadota bacterium]MEE3099995.1 MFS transporter [Pseudomonadota bacterium]
MITPRAAAIVRTGGFYAAMFGALGAHLPFWPLWLSDWGLTDGEIGAYLGAGIVLRLIAGLGLPVLADRREARRLTLGLVAGLGSLLFLSHLLVGSKPVLLILTMLTAGIFSAMIPIADALTGAAARVQRFEYAPVRAVGSAAFLAMNLLLGAALVHTGTNAILAVIVVCLAAAAVLGATHPGGGKVQGGARPSLAEMRRLVTGKVFLAFTAASGLAQASHGVIYAYGSVHWRELGVAETTIGMLWAAGVAVEVVLMAAFGPWLVRVLKPSGAIALAGAAGVVRWTAMTFDPEGAVLWALQASHALTFAAAHLGIIAFIARGAPDRLAGAAQAVMQAFGTGILMAVASGAAALVYPSLGAGAWWIAAAMSGAALALAIWARRMWDGGPLPA